MNTWNLPDRQTLAAILSACRILLWKCPWYDRQTCISFFCFSNLAIVTSRSSRSIISLNFDNLNYSIYPFILCICFRGELFNVCFIVSNKSFRSWWHKHTQFFHLIMLRHFHRIMFAQKQNIWGRVKTIHLAKISSRVSIRHVEVRLWTHFESFCVPSIHHWFQATSNCFLHNGGNACTHKNITCKTGIMLYMFTGEYNSSEAYSLPCAAVIIQQFCFGCEIS